MNISNKKQYNFIIVIIDNIKTNDVVLDLGFGNGKLMGEILSKKHLKAIYGIDISKDMFNYVSKKYDKLIQKKLMKIFLEDISKTSFEENTFDKIYSVNTVYFWKDLNQCFCEIKRILKPNGQLLNIIITKQYWDYEKYGFKDYSVRELKEITEKHGMKNIEIKEIIKNESYCIISENEK